MSPDGLGSDGCGRGTAEGSVPDRAAGGSVERVLAVWVPDWPVTAAALAARVPAHRPAAVLVAGRVLACSAVARTQGVRRGLRRREAQARCPGLVLLDQDSGRDARAFEPVVAAVEELAPGVEVVRPGLVMLPARGPVGFFGGASAAAERLVDAVAAAAGVESQVGVADGMFGALLAARRGVAVEPGGTRAFLAPLEVGELDREPDVDRAGLVSLLQRLGLRSLGAFAALAAGDVASRFGVDAVACHRLARGLDPRPPLRRVPPEELAVEIEFDPPVDRVDAAAFAARALAERLHHLLAARGLSCTRLGIGALTTTGAALHRVWRCAEPLTPSGTVDRVRWQLDAWLTAHARRRPEPAAQAGPFPEPDGAGPGAVLRLRLIPEETPAAGALQLGLWGGVGEGDERAGRALVRVQALLGPESVVTGVLTGGRDPADRVRLVPWGDDRGAAAPAGPRHVDHPAPTSEDRIGSPPVPAATDDPFGDTADAMVAVAEQSDARPGAGAGPDDLIGHGDEEGQVAGRPGRPALTVVTVPDRGVANGAMDTAVPDPAVRDRSAPDSVLAVGAPAGWPADVVHATGRVAAVDPAAAAATAGLAGLRRRPPAPSRSSISRVVHEPPPTWPGRLPAPSPAVVPPEPLPADLLDPAGVPVHLVVSDQLSAPPALVVVDGARPRPVTDWAGPWPVRGRWWAGEEASSRLQVVLDDGTTALLLSIRAGRWWVIGIYD